MDKKREELLNKLKTIKERAQEDLKNNHIGYENSLRAGLTGFSLGTGGAGFSGVALVSLGTLRAGLAAKQAGVGVSTDRSCRLRGGFGGGEQLLHQGGGRLLRGVFGGLGAGADEPQGTLHGGEHYLLRAGAVHPHHQVRSRGLQALPRDGTAVLLIQQAADADLAGTKNGGAGKAFPLRGKAEPHLNRLDHAAGEQHGLGHRDGGLADMTNDHKLLLLKKYPCTNARKTGLFCSVWVKITQ